MDFLQTLLQDECLLCKFDMGDKKNCLGKKFEGNPIILSNMNSNCSNLLYMINLQEQVKKALCYQKIFWPFSVWTNCSGDLKFFANSEPSAMSFKKKSWSQEQFFLTVGQNNFGNQILFLSVRATYSSKSLQNSHIKCKKRVPLILWNSWKNGFLDITLGTINSLQKDQYPNNSRKPTVFTFYFSLLPYLFMTFK